MSTIHAYLTAQSISTVLITGILLFICFKIIKKPIGCLFRLAANTIGGFVVLFVLNWLGDFIGISIGVNWMNALIVGIFGLPGVGFLLMFQWLLTIS